MSMRTSTDVGHAVRFLTWLFGEEPNGYIYILRQRPSTDPAEDRQGKLELNPAVFSQPGKIDTFWWGEQGHLWSMVFSTATIKNRIKVESIKNNQQANTVALPALWVDIDGCKKLGIPGDEFYRELRESEEVSAWTRSSENGIQGFWKLKEALQVDGDKDLFVDEMAGILWDIMLYYGGDPAVVRLGNLMRLPGSLNVKKEYDTHYMAQAKIFEDNNYTLKQLRERFKPDPDMVPKLISYAVTRALVDIYESGGRHTVHMLLAGTARKAGINKKAAENLCRVVCKWFGDGETEDRLTAVATTYERPYDECASLYGEHPQPHAEIDKAINLWVELKTIYCKKRGFDFTPENYDPTQPPQPNAMFWEENLQTMFVGRNGDPEVFANFVIELRGKVIKADTFQTCWMACIKKQGDQPTLVEIPAEKLSTWIRFNSAVPVGLSLLSPALWNQYIAWLDSTCPDITMMETRHYGILDAEKGKPTILIPGIPHDNYVWTGGEDTAEPGMLSQPIGREDAVDYLDKFAECYPGFHEPRFIWPSLGWFASSMVSELIWQEIKGFPTLLVSGLSGSGKTHLFEHILAPHIGSQKLHSYKDTTPYALKTRLVTNNICPLVMDEFKILPGKKQEDRKSNDLEGIIRNLFDRHQTSMGSSTGRLIKGILCTPLCIMGEHHYADEATTQRTYTIRLDRTWVNKCKLLTDDEQKRKTVEREWLYSYENRGKLGRIIIGWVSKHMDELPEIIERATKMVQDSSPITRVDRKVKNFIAIVTGHLMLRRIYEDYTLSYPLGNKQMLETLYAADTHLMDSENYDTETLKTLFEATDYAVMQAIRQKSPLEGFLFTYDLEDPDIAYFDMGRWFRHLSEYGGSLTSAAALTDKMAFRDLLKDHVEEEGSPIRGFPEDHPYFTRSCVKIDLSKVQKRYGINVGQWRGPEGFQDV